MTAPNVRPVPGTTPRNGLPPSRDYVYRGLGYDQLDPNWVHVLTAEGIQHAIIPSDAREAAALHVLGWTVNCYDATSRSLVISSPPSGTTPPVSGLVIPPPGVPGC